MRIFAGGISTETNTFSPLPTGSDDFRIQRQSDYEQGCADNAGFDLDRLWGHRARARGDTFLFGIMAKAPPGGRTVARAYESMREELLDDLRAALPVDIVLLMLHGAMLADGYGDCEEDIISSVRAIVGPDCVIGVELDLHCHLSARKIEHADLVITYKEYPHVDVNARADELFDLAVATASRQVRPHMELFDCRMIGLYPTTREPLSDFVAEMSLAQSTPGVLSVSFAHGFQWADVPHMGSKVLVITDGDPAMAKALAAKLGGRVYGIRTQIAFHAFSRSLDESFAEALSNPSAPIVIADQSDNVGCGSPGDSTYALDRLLEQPGADAALAILYDPQVVGLAKTAGEGAVLRVRLGGKLSESSGRPLDLDVLVTCIRENYVHEFKQQSGDAARHYAGDVVALRAGNIDIIVSSNRCQCFDPGIFFDLGVDAHSKKLLLVKSAQHFYTAFSRISDKIIYMAAPGAAPPDPRLNRYELAPVSTLFPWDEDPLRTSASELHDE